MANKIQSIDLDKTPKHVLQSILEACERIDAEELGIKDIYRGGTVTWAIPELDLNYQNTTADEFNEIIKRSTNQDSIRRAYAEIYEKVQKLSKPAAPEMKGADKSPVDANIPSKALSEQQMQEYEAREAKREETIEKSDERVERNIELAKARHDELEQIKKGKIKVIPVEAIPVKPIDEKAKKQLLDTANAIKTDPGTVEETIKTRLKSAIAQSPPEVREQFTDSFVNQYTSDFISRAAPLAIYTNTTEMPSSFPMQHPASITATLANPNDINFQKFVPNASARKLLAQQAASLSLAIDAQNQAYRQLASTWMEPDAVDALYPDQVVRYQIAPDQQKENEDSAEIDIEDIVKSGQDIEDVYNRVRSFGNKAQAAEDLGAEFTSTYSVYPTYTPASLSTPEGVAVVEQTSTLLNVVPSTFGAVHGYRQGALAAQWAGQKIELIGAGTGVSTPLLTASAGEMMAVSHSFSANLIFNASVGKFSLSVITLSNGPTQVLTVGARLGNKVIGGYLASNATKVAVGTLTSAGKGLVAKPLAVLAGSRIAGWLGKGIAALSGATGPVGWIIGAAIGVVTTFIPKIIRGLKSAFSKYAKPVLIGLGIGFGYLGGLFVGSPFLGAAVGGLTTFGMSAITSGGLPAAGSAIGGATSGLTSALVLALKLALVAIGAPIISIFLGFTIFTALILFIINSGAYVVPFFDGDISIAPALGENIMGGLVSNCVESAETGPDITAQFAARIANGKVNLLPNTVWGRRDGICIKPTMIIMHWSGGANDDPDGNQRTYDTLVARRLSCQLATDTNDTWLMEKFFEKEVEFPACAGEWNTYSINNEMAGAFFTGSPPPPNRTELELAYNVTCKAMKQYQIPWSQIYGHYNVPNSGGKPDPGKEFLEKVFIPEIRRRCPNGN